MKKALAVAALGVAALATRRYLARRDDMMAVPPELRSPILPFIPDTENPRSLPLARLQSRIPMRSGPGVTVSKRVIGAPPVPVHITTPDAGSAPRPAVLWIHGGGMIVGSPQFEAMGTGRVAREVTDILETMAAEPRNEPLFRASPTPPAASGPAPGSAPLLGPIQTGSSNQDWLRTLLPAMQASR